MCGIAGVLNLNNEEPITEEVLRGMIAAIRHRGPDESGYYRDRDIGMVSTRLSILDLAGGQQPIGNEDGTRWIVFNGEIFNFQSLRQTLEARGHVFKTNCDTEVVLHSYEEYGPQCLQHLNGQFAIAIWDSIKGTLFLARDRMGIRPLHYAKVNGRLAFGSEIKSMLAIPGAQLQIDPIGLQETFTFWAPTPPRTAFKDVAQLPPAHYMLVERGRTSIERYWELDFVEQPTTQNEADIVAEFGELLADATRVRLQADVPVGAYLSGGIDSSITATLIKRAGISELHTFSIGFEDREYDETKHQRRMVEFLGTKHHELISTNQAIGQAFPEVIWHTETPVLRSAPAPMYLLSKNVNQHGYKVVLTGEGADEVLAGYGIFKEMRARRFWAKNPESQIRPLLLQKLYPDIPQLKAAPNFLEGFFRRGLEQVESPYYSHHIRWQNGARLLRLLQDAGELGAVADYGGQFPIPARAVGWSNLGLAQYLEISSFMSPYLLSSQGDRAAMAHSVEGRYPFLDHRLVEFCGRLPSNFKLRGLREKWLLKKLGRQLIPDEITSRTKRPYRAPIRSAFFPDDRPLPYIDALTTSSKLEEFGMFRPEPVEMLLRKAKQKSRLSEADEMALIGVISGQLLYQMFIQEPKPIRLDLVPEPVKVVDKTKEFVPTPAKRRRI